MVKLMFIRCQYFLRLLRNMNYLLFPKIVKSFNENIPLIKNAITSGYTLDEFFTESPEVPVFFQIKLRYSVKTLAGALRVRVKVRVRVRVVLSIRETHQRFFIMVIFDF